MVQPVTIEAIAKHRQVASLMSTTLQARMFSHFKRITDKQIFIVLKAPIRALQQLPFTQAPILQLTLRAKHHRRPPRKVGKDEKGNIFSWGATYFL